jgi:hypothetical protein
MEIDVFIPSGSNLDKNIPDASKRHGDRFWQFLQQVLGFEPERYRASTGELDWQLEAVARRDRRMTELNAPFEPTLGEVVATVVEETVEAIKTVAKVSKLTEARQWVAKTLAPGPMTTKLEKSATKANIEHCGVRSKL